MKYLNAKDILPALLVKELQGYIQGGYIYIPANENQHRRWGEVSGYRGELQLRNEKIVEAYNKGFSIEHLAEKYSLSVSGIRRIIYQNSRKGLLRAASLLYTKYCRSVLWIAVKHIDG